MDQKASAKVLVLDFGAQYGQLIARRVRDLNVYSEIVPCDISADEIREMNASALILSGGPASVYAEDAPSIDPAIFDLGLPVLGFCYGHQITAVTLGGKVGHSEVGEYGRATITRTAGAKLFNSTPMEQTVWMSHRDAVSEVPEGFTVTASTDVCPVAAMECPERKIFTTQFHPEVKHSEYGQQLLSNFLFEICGLEPNWSMDNLVETMTAEFREKVGNDRVILALSGGVDSSVVAALGARAVGKQMTCVFINHGLLRKGEPEQVEEVFTKQFDVDFIHVHAEDRYAELLAGVTEPEEKRRIIGTQFWKEFFAVAQQLETDGKPVKYLAQGTIYPDIIESGARKTGGKTATIKSHHNLIPFPEGVHFDLISRSITSLRTRSARSAVSSACRSIWSCASRSRARVWPSASSVRSTRRNSRSSRTPMLLCARSSTPTTSVCLSRPASATPSTAAGSISRFCPTLSPSALWATSAPTSVRSSCVPSSPAMP